MMEASNFVLVYLTGSLGSCFAVVALLYNLVAGVLYAREETEGRSSSIAITSWAFGILAMLLFWLPCVGGVAAMVAIAVGYLERGRIYRDQSSLASATPVRMGISNGFWALVLHGVLLAAMAISWLSG